MKKKKKHSQSVNKVAEGFLHAFRHEEAFQSESFKKKKKPQQKPKDLPHDNVSDISYMSSVNWFLKSVLYISEEGQQCLC